MIKDSFFFDDVACIEVENYHQFIYDFEEFRKKKIVAAKRIDSKESPQSPALLREDCDGTAEKQSEQGSTAEKNYWVTAIGDFIFEARIPKYIFEIIEKIYAETNSLAEYNANQINNLFFKPGKTTLTISRNKKRAYDVREEVKALYEVRVMPASFPISLMPLKTRTKRLPLF